jgi:hypothetical protein
MRLTKDEARILAEAMAEYKYKVVENPHYKELGVFDKLFDLQYRLEIFGDDKRRNGRTSQDNFNDLIKRLANGKHK